jgi:hypothetical protein
MSTIITNKKALQLRAFWGIISLPALDLAASFITGTGRSFAAFISFFQTTFKAFAFGAAAFLLAVLRTSFILLLQSAAGLLGRSFLLLILVLITQVFALITVPVF